MITAAEEVMQELMKAKNAVCVGCGHCCRTAPCSAAVRVYGPVSNCPALIYSESDERYYCDLCRIPGLVGEGFREELSIGAGCCSPMFNTDRENIPPPPKKKSEEIRIDKQFRAFLHQIGRLPLGVSGDLLWLLVDSTARELGKSSAWKTEVLRVIREERSERADEFMGTLEDELKQD